MSNLIQIREEKRLFKCVEKCPDGHLGEVQTRSPDEKPDMSSWDNAPVEMASLTKNRPMKYKQKRQ